MNQWLELTNHINNEKFMILFGQGGIIAYTATDDKLNAVCFRKSKKDKNIGVVVKESYEEIKTKLREAMGSK